MVVNTGTKLPNIQAWSDKTKMVTFDAALLHNMPNYKSNSFYCAGLSLHSVTFFFVVILFWFPTRSRKANVPQIINMNIDRLQ